MMYKPLKLVLLHTIFSGFVFCFYILTNVPLPSFTPPSTFPLLVMFRFGQDSHGCQHAMAYQLPVRRGTFSPMKAGWGSEVGGIGLKSRKLCQRQTLHSHCSCWVTVIVLVVIFVLLRLWLLLVHVTGLLSVMQISRKELLAFTKFYMSAYLYIRVIHHISVIQSFL